MENDDHLAVLNINVGTAGVLEPENVKEIRDFIDGVFTTFVPGKPFTTTGIRVYASRGSRWRQVAFQHDVLEQNLLAESTDNLKLYLVRKFEIELNNMLEKV